MTSALTPLRLIGNPEENFYILGKKHQGPYRKLAQAMQPKGGPLHQITQALARWGRNTQPQLLAPAGSWGDWLQSYCEGLEVPVALYLQLLAQIESKVWASGSSTFLWNVEGQWPEHLRTVDWPLSLRPGAECEVIYLKVPNLAPVVLITVQGLPFLPLTLMNDTGLTLALHPKYHPLQHPEGSPIGKIALEAMLECRGTTELKKYLKRQQTQRLWGLHACDPSGQVVAMDIMGPQMDGQTLNLQDERLLVFTNSPLVKDAQEEGTAAPPNFAAYCRERRRWCLDRLSEVKGSALLQLTRAQKLHRALAPAVTLSTLQSFSLRPQARRLEVLQSPAPAWARQQSTVWNDLFQSDLREASTESFSATKEEKQEWAARERLAHAQLAMDQGEVAHAFHELQMGMAQAQGELKQLAQWIWPWWQWKHLKGRRDRLHLPQLVQDTLAQASQAYKPQLSLLLFLLETELELAPTVGAPDLPAQYKEWADAYTLASALPRAEMLQRLEARLDLQDLTPLALNPGLKARA